MIGLKKVGKRQILKDEICKLIRTQNLKPGDQILSQNQLAEKFKVNPLTVFRALTELCEEKVIYRENGRGTFVGPKPLKVLNVALVLPGANLEAPEYNPDHWPFVMDMLKNFTEVVGAIRGIFSTVTVDEMSLDKDSERFRHFDLVFAFGLEDRDRFVRLMVENNVLPVVWDAPKEGDDKGIYLEHDRVCSVRLGISDLLMRGYRKIGLFNMQEFWGDGDIEGYKLALKDFGVPFDENLIFRGFSLRKDAPRAVAALLAQGMPCDAIFTDTDLLGLGMIESFEAKGIRVPEDIGVMGYTGLSMATANPPYLNSVRLPYKEMILWALKSFEQMDGRIGFAGKFNFTGEVLSGKTLREAE
jgi:DNA-binding LacI/PurR family transcriptional regulator